MFEGISYLKNGNKRQREAYQVLKRLQIFENLVAFKPILVGTIPIEIDIPGSDLDIICSCKKHQNFIDIVSKYYAQEEGFSITQKTIGTIDTTIIRFNTFSFPIEFFAQNRPTKSQLAYQHMLIEYQILQSQGQAFKQEVIELKKQGMKTEPAFAKLLHLQGDPYKTLLTLKL